MNSVRCLSVSNLACSRGERRLFEGLSFRVESSNALLITGPNGSGKTTLLRAVAGFLTADSGEVRLEDVEGEVELAFSLHYLGHRDGLKAALTVRENLLFAPALLSGAGASLEEAAERLQFSGLLDLPVAVLSAGQRRRTALARLLMVRRPLWLLDEPTAALDTASTDAVATIITNHVASGGIVIAATHLPLGIPARELAFQPDGSVIQRDAS